ncbi:MAG: hypothetical protein KDA61_09325, partial [Planctomycetales bacterium]|nr:hypothetical protein [Planctomycetales bacterium]
MDHELEDDSRVRDVDDALSSKDLDNEDDDDNLSLDIDDDDSKLDMDGSLDLEGEEGDAESWSDDPVRMYLTQM